MSAARGFTLIELVVAITIVAALTAVAPFALSRAQESMQYRATVRELLAALKASRLEAMRSGRPVTFVIDLRERRYGRDDRLDAGLPDDLDVRLIVAQSALAPGGRGGIRFYPDGSATGGSIEVLRPSGGGVRLRVDWLLGRVTQEAPG